MDNFSLKDLFILVFLNTLVLHQNQYLIEVKIQQFVKLLAFILIKICKSKITDKVIDYSVNLKQKIKCGSY